MKRLGLILAFAILNFGALGLGGWLMDGGPTTDWYLELNKAPWTPAGWVFGLAWTSIMICFTFYMAHLFSKAESRWALWLYSIQLVTNISWNYFFFGRHMMLLGLIVLTILTVVVWMMFFKFKKQMGISSYLLIPYMIWLLVACSLNAYAWLNN